jgi:hypothetical protein
MFYSAALLEALLTFQLILMMKQKAITPKELYVDGPVQCPGY